MQENFGVDITVDAMANDTTSNKSQDFQTKRTTFDKKNYLDVKIPKGATEKTLRIRLLPFPETKSPFCHIHMHTVRVPKEISESTWKSYVCIDKTEGINKETYGGKCSFCEINKKAFQDMLNANDAETKAYYKEMAKANMPREAVIMRCIERGKEDEGVKFWKVNIRQDKGDAYNLIRTLYENRRNEWLADPENQGKDPKESNILSIREYGYDLIITFKIKEELNQTTNKVEAKTSILVTDAKKPCPLTTNPELGKQWVYDPKKWYEVFVPKHYDYTALVSTGKIPFFDKNLRKWVASEQHKQDVATEVDNANKQIEQATFFATTGVDTTPKNVTQQLMDGPVGLVGPDDELPL